METWETIQYEFDHYGVKGMRWGVHKKVSNVVSDVKGRIKKKKEENKEDLRVRKERKNILKKRRILDDREIDKMISRLQKEKTLKELTKNNLESGKSTVSRMLTEVGKNTTKTVISGMALYGIKYAITKHFDPEDFIGYVTPRPKRK